MADQIVAKSESTYTPAPEGQFQAVCCDVIDLGMVENKTYGKLEHKVAIVFQLEDETGARHEVAARFTVSMHEKARLRQFLSQWRGKSYTDDEAKQGTPLHKLEGQNAFVQIEHQLGGNGKTYANIASIMRPPKGTPAMTVKGYVRSEHWKKAQAPLSPPSEPEPAFSEEEYEEIPF